MTKEAHCFLCDKKFGFFWWKHFCEECGRMFCSSCIKKFDEYGWCITKTPIDNYERDYLCNTCWGKKVSIFHSKYIISVKNSDSVETFPKTYKGSIPIQRKSNFINIESDFIKDKDDALKYLQVTALIEGYDAIYDLKYEKKTESEDNYKYSVWKAVGKAGKRLK